MALQTIAKDNKSAKAASAHLPVASGRTIAKDSAATTEITMAAPAGDERGGVSMGPEKTKLRAMLDSTELVYSDYPIEISRLKSGNIAALSRRAACWKESSPFLPNS